MMKIGRLLLSALLVVPTLLLMSAPADAATPRCTTTVPLIFGKLHGSLPISATTGLPDCLMKQGDSNSAVRVMQRLLVKCYLKKITVDGIFGAKTFQALSEAQGSMGVTPDGVWGKNTSNAALFDFYDDNDIFRQCH